MRRIVYLLISLLSVTTSYAQNKATTIAVHAGEHPLEQLLTDEQCESVTHLTITGTLHDEDYEFIRNNKWEYLREIDLRNTEIDTIPNNALKGWKCYSSIRIKIILPESLKYIGDFSFVNANITLELTGRFPNLGHNFSTEEPISMTVSADNSFCKGIIEGYWNEFPYVSIYSADGRIFYYTNVTDEIEILPGTCIIAGNAFENRWINHGIVLPTSLDSIGDYAFACTSMLFQTGYSNSKYPEVPYYNEGRIICECETPPLLGENVFKRNYDSINYLEYSHLFVPDESIEKYMQDKYWSKAMEIKGLSNFTSKVEEAIQKEPFSILENSISYTITASKNIKTIKLFNTMGQEHFSCDIYSNSTSIRKDILVYPCSIMCIFFTDGTKKSFKLKNEKRTF